MKRSYKCLALLLLCGAFTVVCGCSSWCNWDSPFVRSQSPDVLPLPDRANTRLVGDLAVPWGLFPVQVESIGLVVGLRGTGSDPSPSPLREMLLDEMRARRVTNPNQVLASDTTAMVRVRSVFRPGIQEGDYCDIEVRVPSRSETTSLRGGKLLMASLREMGYLGNRIRNGKRLGTAVGPIMVDPSADAKGDEVLSGRGWILGGGRVSQSRHLRLVLKPDHQKLVNSARTAEAVNKRFHSYYKGIKTGVANAKDDKSIVLKVHPDYKDNVQRYVQVVRAIALRESPSEQIARLSDLSRRLQSPETAAQAALELEALGKPGVDTLKEGIESLDPEVRFYSAEALAYLDQREAAKPLGEAAEKYPAFRVFALTALSAMNCFDAREQLQGLLEVPSAETRYGAFRALWAMNPDDSLVLGETLGGQFSYHVLDLPGPDMIHVTRTRRPEIVVFGKDQQFKIPFAVNAGNHIMVTSRKPGEISVSRFVAGEPSQQRTVSTQVDDVIRAIAEVGGTYPDVVQALQEAKAAGVLASRFEVEALPTAGRAFERGGVMVEDDTADEDGEPSFTSPMPDLFTSNGRGSDTPKGGDPEEVEEKSVNEEDSPHPVKAFFARIAGSD